MASRSDFTARSDSARSESALADSARADSARAESARGDSRPWRNAVAWSAFAAADPTLATALRALLQQYGPGLAYLATVRADGGPRLHPVSPVFTASGLYCFVVDSPKRRDLLRDGRYALHAYPAEDNDDEAYLTGRAVPVRDTAVIRTLAGALHAAPEVDWRLFELLIDVAMLRRHALSAAVPLAAQPRTAPITRVWKATSARAGNAVVGQVVRETTHIG